MHIARVLDTQWFRRNRTAGPASATETTARPAFAFRCCSGVKPARVALWCLVVLLICCALLSIGLFEATRLTTHVLQSPCTVLGSEMVGVTTCTLCGYGDEPTCEVNIVATARLAVTFRPHSSDENVTGWVWFCKSQRVEDPCQRHQKFPDQELLDTNGQDVVKDAKGTIPCTVGEVFAYMQFYSNGGGHKCYYNSRDPGGEDVWLTMPPLGLADHVWFEKHMEYPILLALGGLVLLTVLLGCLALEGAEMWASGLAI